MEHPWGKRGAIGVGIAVTAVVALALVPSWRTAIVVLVSCVAALSPLVGIVVHRPANRLPWFMTFGMLACWGASQVVMAGTPHPQLGLVCIASGQVFAAGLVAVLFAEGRKRLRVSGHLSRADAAGRGADSLVLAVVMILAVVQGIVALLDLSPGVGASLGVTPSVDAVLACFILRFMVSRPQRHPSNVMILSASVVTDVYDLLVTHAGHRVTAPHGGLHVLWVLAACLYALACVHPSMARAFAVSVLRTRRSESLRLLGLAPLAAAPAGLYAVGGSGRLPVLTYLLVGALVTALAIVRGAQALRISEQRAERDPLTGLANRRGLKSAFVAASGLARGEAAGDASTHLCLLDLDDFKHVNDTYGHEAGDDLLREVANRLRAAVGTDGMVARSGGDEFVLILGPRAPQASELVAAVFADPVVIGDRPHRVRASAGVAVVTSDAALAHVLADADVALHAAKVGSGERVVHFESALREAVLGRSSLVADLRLVLGGHLGGGQLHVHYQPLTHLESGDPVGCEALVRWSHPERGMVPPDSFLPLAEEFGLATEVDRWVLREALRQLARWDAAGVPAIPVSVNLGRSSMTAPDLGPDVMAALEEAGVAPERLHLEITEHDELPAGAGAALHLLSARGVGVSIDDFGVGYTSLEYLHRFPVDVLKIDCSLTRPLQVETTSPLVAGIVSLARSLGVTVLAEGIETAAQLRRLAWLGVDQGQGYFMARPLPPAEFAAWMLAPKQVQNEQAGSPVIQ